MRRLISAGVAPVDAAEQAKAHEGEVIIEGIVEMTGDGTALMTFKGLSKRVYINLTSGETQFEN